MQILLIILAFVLVLVVILQVGKVVELVSVMRDEDERTEDTSNSVGFLFLLSGIVLGLFIAYTSYTEYGKFLPVSASEHGVWIQDLVDISLYITGIVFIITNVLLFYFAYKYRYRRNRKALYFPYNNRIEILWTVIPTLVLTVIIGLGLNKWFKIFSEAPTDAIQIEVTGKQFAWVVRYGGKDNELGKRDFTLSTVENELGVRWKDKVSKDDFLSDEIVIPVNTPVHVNIGALDVIHSFYLPEFRVMMDAVPGIPTKFWFRPTITTEQMREIKKNPEFDYELACNQLCGTGHWNMKKTVRVVTEAEYKKWFSEQKSYYKQNIAKIEGGASVDTDVIAEVNSSKD
ncbi:MAG: cytochrome c oxidase subunit II [Chitinophagales bacterium]|nr:cytochrome c oxidase subunit II [Chitinophagales bacterium]